MKHTLWFKISKSHICPRSPLYPHALQCTWHTVGAQLEFDKGMKAITYDLGSHTLPLIFHPLSVSTQAARA